MTVLCLPVYGHLEVCLTIVGSAIGKVDDIEIATTLCYTVNDPSVHQVALFGKVGLDFLAFHGCKTFRLTRNGFYHAW